MRKFSLEEHRPFNKDPILRKDKTMGEGFFVETRKDSSAPAF
jgi:hypothetical protein